MRPAKQLPIPTKATLIFSVTPRGPTLLNLSQLR